MSEKIDQKAIGLCPHGNFSDRCPACNAEAEPTMTLERAIEILGEERVFGPDRVREVFGVSLEQVPEIPFSKEALEKAKENDERLILRIDRFDAETPLTLRELTKRVNQSGERLFSDASNISDALDWVEGMGFQETRTPKSEWKLIWTKPLHGVRHLSFNAQQVFISADAERMTKAVEEMKTYWNELLQDPDNEGLKSLIEEAGNELPSVQELMDIRKRLPETGTLPAVIEAIYDAKMVGGAPFDNMSVVTNDTVEPFQNEPERPIDISFLEDGISLHVRRDKRFGRPNKLGTKKDFVAGIPIGYIQH